MVIESYHWLQESEIQAVSGISLMRPVPEYLGVSYDGRWILVF